MHYISRTKSTTLDVECVHEKTIQVVPKNSCLMKPNAPIYHWLCSEEKKISKRSLQRKVPPGEKARNQARRFQWMQLH